MLARHGHHFEGLGVARTLLPVRHLREGVGFVDEEGLGVMEVRFDGLGLCVALPWQQIRGVADRRVVAVFQWAPGGRWKVATTSRNLRVQHPESAWDIPGGTAALSATSVECISVRGAVFGA